MTAHKPDPPGQPALGSPTRPTGPTGPTGPTDPQKLEDATLDAVREAFNQEINPELEKRLSGALRDFRRDLQEHPYILRLERRKNARGIARWLSADFFLTSPAARRLAAGLGAGVIALIVFGVLQFGKSASTWTEVAARFQSVPFLNAMISVKTDALSQPQQMDVCLSQDGHGRVQTGDQVIFGNKGKVTSAFDVTKNTKAAPDVVACRMLELMTLEGSISLDTVMQACYGDKLADVTLTINKDAMDSGDIIVFDARSSRGGKEARLWALRSSRLPVHLRVADAGGARSTDAFFTYPKTQTEGFFDPKAFEKTLAAATPVSTATAPIHAAATPIHTAPAPVVEKKPDRAKGSKGAEEKQPDRAKGSKGAEEKQPDRAKGSKSAEEKQPDRAKGSKGTIIGDLTKKDGGKITVKSDTEEMALMPDWQGGVPADGGGNDKEMMKRLEGFKVGDKVKVTWTLEEHYRIDTINHAE